MESLRDDYASSSPPLLVFTPGTLGLLHPALPRPSQGFVHTPSCSARGPHELGWRLQSSLSRAALQTSSPPLSRRRARTSIGTTAVSTRWWSLCSGRGLGFGLGASGVAPLVSETEIDQQRERSNETAAFGLRWDQVSCALDLMHRLTNNSLGYAENRQSFHGIEIVHIVSVASSCPCCVRFWP